MNNKLIKGSEQRYNRGNVQTVTFARDIDDLVNQYDMMKLIGQSRSLYHNNPLVKAAIDKKASFTISNAFEYRSLSKTKGLQDTLNDAMKQWGKIAEVSGKTFNDVLWLTSMSLDVDGDVFWLLTETKEGYPQVQLIEAHAVGSRQSGKIDHGNLYEEKGVLYDKKTKRPIKYRILGKDESQDKLVSVKDMIRVSEPSMSQRGIPLTAACMRLMQDLEHSQDLLLTQHLLAASQSFVIHNETGSADEVDLSDDESYSDSVGVEVVNEGGGENRYFKAGSGSKMEMITNQNPALPWQQYQDTLTNLCMLALDMPKTFVGMNDGTGVNDRLAIQQAAKTCVDRMSLLVPFASRLCNWAIAKMVKNGYIKAELTADWYECYFTKARSITVDFARDSKMILAEYDAGIKNLGQILADDGRDLEPHIRERYREEAIRIRIKQEVEQEFDVKLDDLKARLISSNQFQDTRTDD